MNTMNALVPAEDVERTEFARLNAIVTNRQRTAKAAQNAKRAARAQREAERRRLHLALRRLSWGFLFLSAAIVSGIVGPWWSAICPALISAVFGYKAGVLQ